MFNPPDYIIPQKSYTQEELEAAVLAEREACAKVCDEYAEKSVEAEDWEAEDVALDCAAVIRARGKK